MTPSSSGIGRARKGTKPVAGPRTPSEQFAYDLCRRSFLNLWSHANPIRQDKNEELCDVLVVFDLHVVVFSVKEIGLPSKGLSSVENERWIRKAVEASAKQLYKAKRLLPKFTHVIRADGKEGLPLPPSDQMRIHLVAVAFGAEGNLSFPQGDMGRGFVHVMDEESLPIVMGELDTITEFIEYLERKEALFDKVGTLVVAGGEKDLLAAYLQDSRTFKKFEEADMLVLDEGFWEAVQRRPEFKARKEADRPSYAWDNLIDTLAEPALRDDPEFGAEPTKTEQVLGLMARERRVYRRVLGAGFLDWYFKTADQPKKVQVRLQAMDHDDGSPSITYVFLACPRDWKRSSRQSYLEARCHVARGLRPQSATVIGLATEVCNPDGWSFDALLYVKPEWTREDQELMERLQKEAQMFQSPSFQKGRVDEFPPENSD